MITKEKPLAQDRRHLLHHRHDRADLNLRKINASQRLIDLQRPVLPCFRIDVIPVVKAKCHVAVFLDLKNNHVV